VIVVDASAVIEVLLRSSGAALVEVRLFAAGGSRALARPVRSGDAPEHGEA
jgi:hypothetical protein